MMETFRLPITKGKTFQRQAVEMDGKRFEDCKFIECVLTYSGGPAELSACEISPNTTWNFQNHAALTIQFLQAAGWRIEYGKEGPASIPYSIPPA